MPDYTRKEVLARLQRSLEQGQSLLAVGAGTGITAKEAAYINQHTSTVGFVGASSIERFACESSIPEVTASFKKIPLN